jgi:mannose-6-phosphate isomerase
MSTTPGLRPSYNPFQSTAAPEAPPEAEVIGTSQQVKPWGHELVFADGSHGYVGKIIHVKAGRALSLQLHNRKDETLTVMDGEVLFESGAAADDLVPTTLLPGDTVHVPAGALHRITAVTDVRIVEVSTAGPGWRDDVVRLADEYGREGTSRP